MNQTRLSNPKRQFCVGGPIPPEGYYVLRDRPEIGQIVEKVEAGKYFVIYAPRQVGKTSLIQEAVKKLSDRAEYLALYLTFQDFGKQMNQTEFYQALADVMLEKIRLTLEAKQVHPPTIDASPCRSDRTFTEWLKRLNEQLSNRLCIFIDEFEDIPHGGYQ